MLEKVELFVKTESRGSKQAAPYQPVQFTWRQRREEEKWFASADASLGLLTIFLAMLARRWFAPAPSDGWKVAAWTFGRGSVRVRRRRECRETFPLPSQWVL